MISFVLTQPLLMSTPVKASLTDDLAAVQKQLAAIQSQKNSIQNDISSQKTLSNQYLTEVNNLKNQINLLDTQIQEKQLTIDELGLQIQIMDQQIQDTQSQIDQTTDNINVLQDQTDNRLVDVYISQKTYSTLNYVFSDGKKDIIKLSVYQKAMQDQTNSLLTQLAGLKSQLADKQYTLELNRESVASDQASIETEKESILKAQADLDQQRALYQNKMSQSLAYIGSAQNYLNSVTLQEQKIEAQEQTLEAEVFNQIQNVATGSFVVVGQVIGRQGCTGICTGPHLHFGVKVNGNYVNPCTQLPLNVLGGCGTLNPTLSWPMGGSFVMTSPYGPRWGSFHYAIDIANYVSDAYIKAAQSGWVKYGFEACSIKTNSLCKNGGANYAVICQNKDNCNSGITTLYWHLR